MLNVLAYTPNNYVCRCPSTLCRLLSVCALTQGGATDTMMPIATRENLAMKLRQNWLTKHPTDLATAASGLDDSLTSLSWLQNLNIMTITTPTPPASPEPLTEDLLLASYSSATQVDPNSVLHMRVKQEPGLAVTNLLKLHNGQHHSLLAVASAVDVAPPVAFDKIDYKNNPYVKPPYSYATLICMAMRETKTNKITLSGIYNWITDNFVYYRNADPSWQVRNTLIAIKIQSTTFTLISYRQKPDLSGA